MKKLLLFLAFAAAAAARAQTTITTMTNEPLTLFEQRYHTPDVTLVRGMAAVSGPDSLFVEVRLERLQVSGSSDAVFAVSLRGRASNYDSVDYIDQDELEGFVRGLQAIGQAGHNVTKMDDFEVTYRTRGGFAVSKSSSGNNIVIIAKSGHHPDQRVQLADYMLNDLTTALSAAKDKLAMYR